jgi:hypothetical protein
VQVELVADGILAAPEPAQHRIGDAVAAEPELVAGLDVEIVRVEGEQVGEDTGFVRAPGNGARAAALALRRTLRLLQGFRIAYRGTKQRAILVLDGGRLRPCAATALLQYSAPRSRHTRPGRYTGP